MLRHGNQSFSSLPSATIVSIGGFLCTQYKWELEEGSEWSFTWANGSTVTSSYHTVSSIPDDSCVTILSAGQRIDRSQSFKLVELPLVNGLLNNVV